MCEKACQYWTGSLPSVKDFYMLKTFNIPKDNVQNYPMLHKIFENVAKCYVKHTASFHICLSK